jgi:pSer/pThr/pTyr-binding forkhead associated (FHA) protein
MSDIRFILKKASNGEERELSGVVPVGREVAGGLKLIDEGASRRHATITVVDGAAYVEDAGSRNGTFVNDRPVTAKTALKSGDRVRFDKEEFDFQIQTSEPTVMGVRPAEKKAVAGAWVDWNTSGSDGTERFTPEQLSEYLRKAKERQAKQPPTEYSEPCLTVASGAQEGRTIPLTAGAAAETQEWTIGRGTDCSIRFDESDISEWHAKIVREGRKWKLIDAISSNGSFINDLAVGMSYLSSGDSLRFGRVECVFHLPGARPLVRGAQGGGAASAKSDSGGNSRSNRNRLIVIAVTASFFITLVLLYVLVKTGVL